MRQLIYRQSSQCRCLAILVLLVNLTGLPTHAADKIHDPEPDLAHRFRTAVMEGDTKRVEALIRQGASLEARDENGRSALHHAAREGRVDTLQYLLSLGANIAALDSHLDDPIHLAVRCGHLDVIDPLVHAGADLNRINRLRESPLFEAANHGQVSMVSKLIDLGAEVNARNNVYGYTALHGAMYGTGDRLATTRALIEAGADVNIPDIRAGWTPLYWAIDYCSLEVVDLLLHEGASLDHRDYQGFPPLHRAFFGCRDRSQTNCCGEVLERLVTQDTKLADPEILSWIVSIGRTDLLERALDAGADLSIHRGGLTYLHLAAQRGHLDVAQALISQGIDPDAPCLGGRGSPLHFAALEGRIEMLSLLLDAGATLNDSHASIYLGGEDTFRDLTSLDLARIAGRGSAFSYLLQRGAKPGPGSPSEGLFPAPTDASRP